ncbi:hypothetical protein TNCV_3549711 [Trichonephila clavipes]|nr:hypothetical protein TNCV_3549711 [Trichonephila clavipes]
MGYHLFQSTSIFWPFTLYSLQYISNVGISVPYLRGGRGSLVVKVTSSWPQRIMRLSPVPLKTCRVGGLCTLNLPLVWKSGEGVPAQVSSSSLDHGSKLQGPSPKAPE